MIKNLIRVYEKVEDLVACIGLICGVGIMFVGVVARYVFGHPLTFVDEIGPIFIVWSTLAGYSIALRKDEHIKMDILLWGDRIFEKCGIRRDEGGDGGKTLEIRGKRRLSARDGGANYQQS